MRPLPGLLALFAPLAACTPPTPGPASGTDTTVPDGEASSGPYVAATVETVTTALPGADGIAWLDAGRVVVSSPATDELWTVELATGETELFSDAVSEPYGLASHPSGDLLVANWGARDVLRITPAGDATVLAETTDRFGNVYVDAPTGDVYLPAFGTGLLERITPEGKRETVSTGVAGQGLHAVMFDDERVLYTGYVNAGTIYRHDADGVGTLFATLPGRLGNLLWVDGQLIASSWDTNRLFTIDAEGRVEVCG